MPRSCSICRHPERRDIEADLKAGIPYRDIARRRNISKDALSRHRVHMPLHTAPALATAMEIKGLLDQAETAPNWDITLLTIREAHRHLEELMTLLSSTVRSSLYVNAETRK
jgi:hypothetical protein